MTTETWPHRRVVVIGVGHRDRGDDGIGPAIADVVRHRADSDIVIHVCEGDLAVLPLFWEPEDDVVIVDAIMSPGPNGKLQEIDPDALVSSITMSTHGVNVADALQLARRLDCMPARLRVFGVSASHFRHGPMSPTLRRLIEPLAVELMHHIGLGGAGDRVSPGVASTLPGDTPHQAPG